MSALESLPLFRAEVLRHRAGRLHGNINIALPIAWQAIGFLLVVALVVGVTFLSFVSYSRVETVPGAVALDTGVATIVPSRAGTISGILVAEGEHVSEGERVAIVRAEESMVAGPTAPERTRDALSRQDGSLADQGRLLLQAARADRDRLAAQIVGDRAAITQLEAQIADQQQLIATAEVDYQNAIEVAKGGFISKRDLQDRQAVVLARRQQLAQLQQLLSDKRAEISQAQRASIQTVTFAQAQVAGNQSGRAGVAQQVAQADLAKGYALTSPVDGEVTALTARLGQPASPDQQLMLVVPSHSRVGVELYVPTTAVAFIAPGQEVRLSVDAFPYQTFGTIKARVTSISRAAITRPTAGGTMPVYLVNAALPHAWVTAFGRNQPLLPGMTLSARIITHKQSLIQWLFEPLLAVRKR